MKLSLSPAVIGGVLVAVLAVAGYFLYQAALAPAPGPSPEVARLTRADMMKQRANGPPRDEAPLPSPKGHPGVRPGM